MRRNGKITSSVWCGVLLRHTAWLRGSLRRRCLTTILLGLTLTVSLLAISTTPTSSADTAPITGSYENKSDIDITGGGTYNGQYVQTQLGSALDYWQSPSGTAPGEDTTPTCGNVLEVDSSDVSSASLYEITSEAGSRDGVTPGQPCLGSDTQTQKITTAKLSNTAAANAGYQWVSATQIVSSDDSFTFTQQSDGTFTDSQSCSGSNDSLSKISPDNYKDDSTATLTTYTSSTADGGSTCQSSTRTIHIAKYDANNPAVKSAPAATTQAPPGASAPTCESNGSALSWIFCSVIDDLSGGVDWIFSNIIQPLLIIKPIDLSASGSDPTHTYEIWSHFRLYGDVFLVIALLVVVYAESIGGGLLDAYTVRKILPRLLIAAVLINLSIYIVALAVDITNIIGGGIANLLQVPFHSQINSGNYYVLHMSPVAGAAGSALTIAAVIGGLWHITAAARILMYLATVFLIPALFIFLAIMTTVILRRGLIIFLIFLSPIAFALYCLPNTEKYFRKWWDLLFRTLLVYPLIAVMFALGNILSVTISSSSSGFIDSALASLIGTISLFVPLFLIPFSFRIAGGLLGRFHEFATTSATRMHQGVLGDKNNPESLRNKMKFRKDVAVEQAGWSGRSISTRLSPRTAFNREQRLANVREVRDARLKRLGQAYFKGDSVTEGNEGNDNFWLALASPEMAKEKLDAATDPTEQAAWRSAIAAAQVTPSNAASRMAAAQKLFASGFQIDTGQKGYNQIAGIVSDITGAELITERDAEGNLVVKGARGPNAGTYANAMNQAQFGERQAGRAEFGGINNGQGYDLEAGLAKTSGYILGAQAKPQAYNAAALGFMGGTAGSTLNALKTRDEEDRDGGAGTYDRKLTSAIHELASSVASGNVSVDKLGSWHEKLLDSRQNATGANKVEIDKQLGAIEGAVAAFPQNGPITASADALTRRVASNHRARRQPIDPNNIDT